MELLKLLADHFPENSAVNISHLQLLTSMHQPSKRPFEVCFSLTKSSKSKSCNELSSIRRRAVGRANVPANVPNALRSAPMFD